MRVDDRRTDQLSASPAIRRRRGWPASLIVIVLCCLADAFVLRSAWTGREVAVGEFRRGYFEHFDGAVVVGMDDAIRPVFPAFLLTEDDELGVPPGVTATVRLEPGTTFALTSDAGLAPYVVVGAEAAVESAHGNRKASTGEGRLVGGRTLSLRDGRLTLEPWDGARPWRDDAARLAALRDGCVSGGEPPRLTITVAAQQIAFALAGCALSVPLGAPESAPVLAVLAGPTWARLGRTPPWRTERWTLAPVLVAIAVKVAGLWWGLGLPAAVATSAVLVIAAIWWPVPAMLTWPLLFVVALAAVLLRVATLALRSLPRWLGVPAVVTAVALLATALTLGLNQPHSFPPIQHAHEDRGQPDACAIIGYSTAGGASLRRHADGLRRFLDARCAACRDSTASLTAGGEVMDWARDAYCTSPTSFGSNGRVIFWGAANDDFLWGVMSVARLFIVGQQTIDQWQRNQPAAVAASAAYIDAQAAAIRDTVRCATERGSRFLYLHDVLVTDFLAGREPERAAMLERRRAAVEAAGGTFIDLRQRFADEAGVTWFNDYLHPSEIIHERVADLVCRELP